MCALAAPFFLKAERVGAQRVREGWGAKGSVGRQGGAAAVPRGKTR